MSRRPGDRLLPRHRLAGVNNVFTQDLGGDLDAGRSSPDDHLELCLSGS
jgi:hypothetical protein